MKIKKKVILMANVMLCAALFCACGKDESNQRDSNEKWEDAYKEIVRPGKQRFLHRIYRDT